MEKYTQILEQIERYSVSTWITLAGVAVGFVALRFLYIHSLDKPRPSRASLLATIGVIIGLFLIVSSQGLRFWYTQTERRVSASVAFDALCENKRAEWLVRLIPYDPQTQLNLTIAKLEKLGHPNHKFVFVADYEELKNYTVEQAVYKTGGSLTNTAKVSAVIFPLRHRELYPANVRGILQVVQKIDSMQDGSTPYKAFPLESHLSLESLNSLKDRRRLS